MRSAAPTLHGERLRAAQAQWKRRAPHWHPGGNDDVRETIVEVKRREPHLLSDEEAWGFDVHGFLIIRGALRGAELAECQALAAEGVVPAGLATHPVALRHVQQLCGAAWRLQGEASLVDWEAAAASGSHIAGGSVPHDHSRAYYRQNGSRWCQGLRALWALADAPSDGHGSGVRLLPASHTLNVPIPGAVLRGEDCYLEALGMDLQPALEAGDLLLHAATLAYGLHSRSKHAPPLVQCNYLAVFVRPADLFADVSFTGDEAFIAELSAEERCVLGLPPTDCPNHKPPPYVGLQPALLSDGKVTRLETPTEVAARAGQPYHPSGLSPPGSSGNCAESAEVDPLEYFYWELTGFLVVRGAMDSTLLAGTHVVPACPGSAAVPTEDPVQLHELDAVCLVSLPLCVFACVSVWQPVYSCTDHVRVMACSCQCRSRQPAGPASAGGRHC